MTYETLVSGLTILAIILGPLCAVYIGGWLQEKSFFKTKKMDVLRRIIAYGSEFDSVAINKDNLLPALLEIKFWYDKDRVVIDTWMRFQKKLSSGASADDELHALLVLLARRENINLSKEELLAVLKRK